MRKGEVWKAYRYYRDKPKASTRAFLHRLLIDLLTDGERRVYEQLIDVQSWNDAVTARQIADVTGQYINNVSAYLTNLMRYGIVVRRERNFAKATERWIYKAIDYLDPEKPEEIK